MEGTIIWTQSEALAFIEKKGLVTLFPVRGTSFPSLYGSTAGKNREERFEKAWTWADNLSQQKKIYYGKLVRKQVTLVSLSVFPHIFKLCHNKEKLNVTAKKILNFLVKSGPTSTTKIRKQLKLMGKSRKSEFTKALDQLQLNLAITVVDREKSPRMTYSWDLVERWMPKELLLKAAKISEDLAKEEIATKLLENKAITKPEEAYRLLGWRR